MNLVVDLEDSEDVKRAIELLHKVRARERARERAEEDEFAERCIEAARRVSVYFNYSDH